MVELYHYSTKPYEFLLTRMFRKDYDQKTLDKANRVAKELGTPGNYLEHISLMFGKLPRDVALMFNGEHEIYKPGMVLYEHVIYLDSIKGDKWEVVSSPEEVAEYRKGNYEREDILKIFEKNKYVGDSISILDDHIKRFSGLVDFYFDEWANSKDEKKLRQYSGGVPHLMVYPKEGRIPVAYRRKFNLLK